MSHQDDHNDCLRCFLLLCQHKPITLYDDKLVYLAKQEEKTDIRMNEWWTCSSLKWTWGRLKYPKWMRFEMWSEDTNTVNCLCQLCFVVNLCNFLTDTINACVRKKEETEKRDVAQPRSHKIHIVRLHSALMWMLLLHLLLFTFISWRQSSTDIDQKSDSRLRLWDAPRTGYAF